MHVAVERSAATSPTAVQRCRLLLDLDADPIAVDGLLGTDPLLAPFVAAAPGRRVPGHVDGAELAARAVLGQQVSVAASAHGHRARLVQRLGERLPCRRRWPHPPVPDARRRSPSAADDALPMPTARRLPSAALTTALAAGEIVIDAAVDRRELDAQLRALPGIGPWTAAYIGCEAPAIRTSSCRLTWACGTPSNASASPADPRSAARLAERWRPWRSYALLHLWGSLGPKRDLA